MCFARLEPKQTRLHSTIRSYFDFLFLSVLSTLFWVTIALLCLFQHFQVALAVKAWCNNRRANELRGKNWLIYAVNTRSLRFIRSFLFLLLPIFLPFILVYGLGFWVKMNALFVQWLISVLLCTGSNGFVMARGTVWSGEKQIELRTEPFYCLSSRFDFLM